MSQPYEITLYWDLYVGECLLAEDIEVECQVHHCQLNSAEPDVGIFNNWWEFGEVEPVKLIGSKYERQGSGWTRVGEVEEDFPEVLKPLFEEWVKNEDERVANALEEANGE